MRREDDRAPLAALSMTAIAGEALSPSASRTSGAGERARRASGPARRVGRRAAEPGPDTRPRRLPVEQRAIARRPVVPSAAAAVVGQRLRHRLGQSPPRSRCSAGRGTGDRHEPRARAQRGRGREQRGAASCRASRRRSARGRRCPCARRVARRGSAAATASGVEQARPRARPRRARRRAMPMSTTDDLAGELGSGMDAAGRSSGARRSTVTRRLRRRRRAATPLSASRPDGRSSASDRDAARRSRVVDRSRPRGRSTSPSKAGAEERVDDARRARAAASRERARPAGAISRIGPCRVALPAPAASRARRPRRPLGAPPGTPRPGRAARLQVARDDEAVAAVVALARHHDHAAAPPTCGSARRRTPRRAAPARSISTSPGVPCSIVSASSATHLVAATASARACVTITAGAAARLIERVRISRTAAPCRRTPRARRSLWPMLSSTMSGMRAIGSTLSSVRPWPAFTDQAERARLSAAGASCSELGLAARYGVAALRSSGRCAARRPRRRLARAASICAGSGSMNRLTRMPPSLQPLPPASPSAAALADDVEPALGRQLLAPLGHEADVVAAACASAMADHLRGRRHLEVQLARASARAQRARRRASWMWRRSSRRWTVMPSAPPRSASARRLDRIGIARPRAPGAASRRGRC